MSEGEGSGCFMTAPTCHIPSSKATEFAWIYSIETCFIQFNPRFLRIVPASGKMNSDLMSYSILQTINMIEHNKRFTSIQVCRLTSA